MNKQERIAEYNKNNPGYAITNIKRLNQDQIEGYGWNGNKSLYDLYQKPSQAKIDSYNQIFFDYHPNKIIGIQGSCYSYSVLLEAENGDILHITKDNNYLVEVTQ